MQIKLFFVKLNKQIKICMQVNKNIIQKQNNIIVIVFNFSNQNR